MGNAMSVLTEEERDRVAATGSPDGRIKTSPFKEVAEASAAVNPKTAAGSKKPPLLSVIPIGMLLVLGRVMQIGANKYGAFNWRETKVPSMTYADAAMRHLISWVDGEDVDPESGVSHLGHVMACMAILVDAKINGMLDDNRPAKGRSGEMINHWQENGEFPDDA